MNMKLRNIAFSVLLSLACVAFAQDKCEIAIGMAPITEGDKVPAGIEKKLQAKLKMALAHAGVAAGDYDCQFFLAGRFDEAFSQEAGGVGGRVLVKTDLQLAICDGTTQKIFATASFPLKGVGATDEQALTRALTSLNPRNPEFINFVEKGKAKIIEYFDNNYQTYLTKAQNALKARNYDEALYWSTSVPECCKGYAAATALTNSVYTDKVNYDGAMLLAQAEGEWAADPTSAGASAAYSYLAQIDPAAACYPQAKALGKKISQTVKDNYDFETKEKYRTEKALERQRINAAKEIGVAWAQNQPKVVYKNNWIRWR